MFVIAAILLERNLQNVANYLIVSLAVADLMVACLVMPLGAVYEVSCNSLKQRVNMHVTWPFPEHRKLNPKVQVKSRGKKICFWAFALPTCHQNFCLAVSNGNGAFHNLLTGWKFSEIQEKNSF